MDAYFHYELTHNTKRETFFEVIKTHLQIPYTVFKKSELSGYLFIEDCNITYCSQFFQSLCQDLYYDVIIMLSYADDAYTSYIFPLAKKLSISSYSDISFITFKALFQMNTDTIHSLNKLFSPLNSDEILVLETFLQNGFNANATSVDLYIHRNTMRYQLQHITDKLGMDMHIFMNAQLFYYWRYS